MSAKPAAAERSTLSAFLGREGRQDRYLVVIGLILVTILSTALLGEGTGGLVLTLFLMTLTFIVTLRTSDAGRRATLAGTVVSVAMVVGVVVALLTGNTEPARIAYGMAMLCIVGVTPFVIVRRMMSHSVVNFSTITGAAAIYLLVGLLFAVIYNLIGDVLGIMTGVAGNVAFFVAQRPIEPSDFVYYSFTTLSTVGYGDLTASVAIGRLLSICEALIGQLYLVIVVAVLVSNMGRSRRLPAPDGPAEVAPETD
jgi:hypothetical protein